MKDLKKKSSQLFNRRSLFSFIFLIILVSGAALRIINIKQPDFVFGYDEVEDLIHVKRIAFNHDLVVIGKAIYGNPNIRHGVLSYYFMVPGLLILDQDPLGVAFWNGIFGIFTIIAVYLLAKSIFKDLRMSLVAMALYASSYLVVEYSGWVSHPTLAPFFVSLFFLGLWKMYEGNKWGWILGLTFLGLSIQSDLLFVYLVPIFILFLIIFRPKYPGLKTFIFSVISLLILLSTIIYTEIKFNFSGIKTILNFSGSFDEGRTSIFERLNLFFGKFLETVSYNITAENKGVGMTVGVLVILIIFVYLLKSKKLDSFRIFFLILFLFSPAITLFLGYHDKPWAFIGILPAISLTIAFVITRFKNKFFITLLVVPIIALNIKGVFINSVKTTFFKAMPESSFLASQLDVVDYTYKLSGGKSFSIDAVTYPLYVNTYWSYHYPGYGLSKYGYVPTWSGSGQIYPHDSLKEADEGEEFLYLIMDNTPDIPSWAKEEAERTLNKKSTLLEEKEIGGFIVQKRKLF